MGMLAKIRRMHIREKLSIREIARRTNLSRRYAKSLVDVRQEPVSTDFCFHLLCRSESYRCFV